VRKGPTPPALTDVVDDDLVAARLRECGELQDAITASRRQALVGTTTTVLVDRPGVGRSHREAPEIDGIIHLPVDATKGLVGRFVEVTIGGAVGPDLDGVLAAGVSGVDPRGPVGPVGLVGLVGLVGPVGGAGVAAGVDSGQDLGVPVALPARQGVR